MKVLRAGAIYMIANFAAAGLPFLLLPLLTRVLDPVQFGQVVAFALIMTVCGTTAGLNVHGAMSMLWFRKPVNEIPAYMGSALALAFFSTVAVALVVAMALWQFPGIGAGLSPIWGVFAAFAAGANIILQMRLVIWRNQDRPILSAAMQFASSLLNLALSLLAVLLLDWGAEGRNGAIAASTCLMALAAVVIFGARGGARWDPKMEHVSTLLRFGAPLILHGMGAVLLSTADRWTVSIKLDAQSLGLYGAGAQLGMIMTILGDAFVKAFSPWLYGKLKSGRTEDRLFVVGALYASMPMFLMAALGLGAFLYFTGGLILGSEYRGAAVVLPWFVLGGAFSGIYLCTAGLYFFWGRTGLLSSVTLASGILGAASTWMLVSAFGLPGAAMGFAGTQMLLACVTTTVAMRSFELPWSRPRAALQLWSTNLLAMLSGAQKQSHEKE